ncbi:hypothetical protein HPB51_001006 [Rhipicephalus microplus]|uniref:superoxide dismutase n=1 Tax=Rhipicephalus microplus TaxID=6941 RepID=A0A9J6DE41_RHIMP|nr:hypothetical protein HPB51_001006 [Rhipicephalus microplus]
MNREKFVAPWVAKAKSVAVIVDSGNRQGLSLSSCLRLGYAGGRSKHTLPDLPYDYKALEPIISADIMHVHHDKHHAAYVNNLNAAEEKMSEALAKKCTQSIISASVAIKFNGGGHLNHSIYWTNLSPNGGGEPKGEANRWAFMQNFETLFATRLLSLEATLAQHAPTADVVADLAVRLSVIEEQSGHQQRVSSAVKRNVPL